VTNPFGVAFGSETGTDKNMMFGFFHLQHSSS
jgi:hypothetical protein